MLLAFRRVIMIVVVSGLVGLPLAILVCAPETAWASAGQTGREPSTSKPTKSAPVGLAPATLGLTTIENLRTAVSPAATRLVLDLDRRTRMPKRPPAQVEGVVIEIPHATLGKAAHSKLAKGLVAKPFLITETSDRAVLVSLPSGSFQSYKMLSLENPPRLVVDVIPAKLPDRMSNVEPAAAEPAMLSDLPPQPLPPKAKSFRTIVIDPGHGGKDPGAHGIRGTEEKDITLTVALKLRDILSKQPGIRVLMTRERDVFVELEDRAKFANSHAADLFVSIHVNSHPQRSVRGIEIYHFGEAKDQRALEVAARENGTPLHTTGIGWEYLVADLLATKKVEASLELAWNTKEAMITHLNGHYALVDHGVKTAPFYVLRFTSMPSILAEIAYISNSAEEALLRNASFTAQVAESLYEGLRAYLRQPVR